ncbi:MAG TPA: symmetrical bis(5'-nucleosyl)-tetraphosphatase [Burkholderiales bacterium]|nr:symmetrical bis(5'-nucleosyl)-tetraphosphatase [Burkholderiales bacterium]
MATYAIGDLQGCFDPLRELLQEIGFNAARDRLWFVGDLVNRGPQSQEVLRFVKGLGSRAVTVLGNHDLHLLMVAEGRAKLHKGDTIAAILEAPDREELLAWMRGLQMMHVEGEYAMVHAGLLPSWSVRKALDLGREVEEVLRGPGYRSLMAHMYGNQPDRWDDALSGYDRLRVIINVMTRLRICTADGRMEFSHKGRLEDIPEGYVPWFAAPNRKSADATLICGHWSALGLLAEKNLLALDSGCLWGRRLSAVRLEDRRIFQVTCPQGSSD